MPNRGKSGIRGTADKRAPALFFLGACGIPVRKGVENVENMGYSGEFGAMHVDAVDSEALQKQRKIARKRQEKWDKQHLRTVSTKLRKEEYAALLDMCMLWGIKPYTLIRRLVRVHVLGREDN